MTFEQMTEDEKVELAQSMYSANGHLILGCEKPMEIGYVLRNEFNGPHDAVRRIGEMAKWKIISRSTPEEFVGALRKVGITGSIELSGYYYKAEAMPD